MTSQASDIFQMLITLPNLREGDDIRAHLLSCVGVLEASGLVLAGEAEPFIAKGRREYLAQLSERADHYWEEVKTILLGHHDEVMISPLGASGNVIRDFHHAAYYSGFFLCRWALVKHQHYDCSMHKSIATELVNAFKGGPNEDVARLTKDKLGTLRAYRDDADYVMHLGRLARLGALNVMREVEADLGHLRSQWGVTP